jgi:hypothetical protein
VVASVRLRGDRLRRKAKLGCVKMTWQVFQGVFPGGKFQSIDEAIDSIERERKQIVSLSIKASGIYCEAIGKKSGRVVEVAQIKNTDAESIRGIAAEIRIATKRAPRQDIPESFGQECDRMSRVAGW